LYPKGKVKQKYELCLPNEELFAFAGLYSNSVEINTGEIKNTHTILTTEASPLLAEIHNHKKRMPVVLKREDESKWLSHEPIAHFAFPYSDDVMAVKL
jgi:putative SOS response-associated peptidase YedK